MAKKPEFAHLHVHTEYSLLDGACRIDKLANRVAELGMDSIAVTDHGVMTGLYKLQSAADKAGVKPIFGIELYFTEEREVKDAANRYYHLTALAETTEGLHNLYKMNLRAAQEGMYYGKPRVDYELLKEYGEGVIVLSGCLAGRTMQSLANADLEPDKKKRMHAARDELIRLTECVGKDNVYVEVQNSGVSDWDGNQWEWNGQLKSLADDLGLMAVGTSDTHYLTADEKQGPRVGDPWFHDTLLCVQTRSLKDDPLDNRMSLVHDWNNPHYYHLRSVEEMKKSLANVPESIGNSLIVAERCNAEIRTGRTFEMLPDFPVPEEYTPPSGKPDGMDEKMWTQQSFLRDKIWEGLHRRYGSPLPAEVVERAEYELEVINKMGTTSYFLITWDWIRYAKEIGMVIGPGRGSGAGSIVLYALDVTQLCPLEHKLLFERFLSPERISMPDVDTDAAPVGEADYDMVRQYLREKYGEDNCAQIITFQTIGGKAGIRAAARAFGSDLLPLADRMAKSVPMDGQTPVPLTQALEEGVELQQIVRGSAEAQKIIDSALWMEGLISAESVHAAAFVISPIPLTDALPVQLNKDGNPVTGFAMGEAESVGCLKLDLLGLRNLSILADAQRLIKKYHDVEVDAVNYQIPMDDQKTFEMLARGESVGVFQFESGGMADTLRAVGTTEFNDLVAIVAAYRPGAMEQIPLYARRKKGLEEVTYGDERMEEILSETYGLILYQEQAMLLSRDLAGFTGGLMDTLRKAIGKKLMDKMMELKPIFFNGTTVEKDGETIEVPGCLKNGVDKKTAEWVWSVFEASANYSFNKSHAAAYALISYVTAYLKANYPVEYMAALLTSVMHTKDKVPFYLYETKRMGIEVLPPSANESFSQFEPSGENAIRFGLTAVKGVGEGIVEGIVKEREANGPFKSLWDFCQRVDGVNRRELDNLIKAGALDFTGESRMGMLEVTDQALKQAKKVRQKKAQGQDSLFDALGGSAEDELAAMQMDTSPTIPKQEFTEMERFRQEREVTGLYVSGHPLDTARAAWERVRHLGVGEISEEHLSEDSDKPRSVTVAGIVTGKRAVYTKRDNKRMLIIQLEDLTGNAEIVVFPKLVEQGMEEFLNEGSFAYLRVSIEEDTRGFGSDDDDSKQIKLIAQHVGPFNPEAIEVSEYYDLQMPADIVNENTLQNVLSTLSRYPGEQAVRLMIIDSDGEELERHVFPEEVKVSPSEALRDALRDAVGAWG